MKPPHQTNIYYTVGGIVLQEQDSVALLQGGCACRWTQPLQHESTPYKQIPKIPLNPIHEASAENRETFMFMPGQAHHELKGFLSFE